MTYKEQYAQWRTLAEQSLGEHINAHKLDSSVLEAMRYSLLGGGKRVRAVLCLASCTLCGAEIHNAIEPACAVEMLHAYSLIHDDLPCMDDDDMRRGKPSCHKQFGEATALLAGDGLLTYAFETLAGMQDAQAGLECVRTLSRAAGFAGMIRGQELDLAAENREITLSELAEVHAHKTGALIRAAARMGAVAAGADSAQMAALDAYAAEVGLVFQIVDDILDCTSNTETLGKPVGSDAQQNKSTYPRLLGLEKSRAAAQEHTEMAVKALEQCFEMQKCSFLREFAQNMLIRIQ